MEGKAVGFSAADCGADAAADDFKYITGMSTILVATIQEVKDRVSQMEFIFCSQIFPHFQAKSKLLHARLADSIATREAEDEWGQKEAGLLSQLEELSRGKRRAEDRLLQLESSLEEMRGMLLNAERLAAEHDAEKKQLLGRLDEEMKKDEVVHRLEREIGEKDAEISRVRGRLEEEMKKDEVIRRLQREIEEKDSEISRVRGRLEEEMKKDEVIHRLEREIEVKAAEISRERGRLEEEMEKDEVIRRLKREIGERAAENSSEREAHQQLLHQLELKDKDLLLEQNKFNHATTQYKHLKSEHNYLLGKIAEMEGSKIDQNEGSKIDPSEGSKSPVNRKSCGSPPSKRKFTDLQDTKNESIQVVSKTEDQKNSPSSCVKAQNGTSVRSVFSTSRLCLPPHATNPRHKNAASTSKADASSSFTRPSVHWRETRVRTEPGVVDPHDDFLDTPLEAARNTVRNPTTREEALALAAPPPQDMDFNNSDDETQDINIVPQGLNSIPVPKQRSSISIQPPNKDFKYTEPVRKKADRANLKGVECKQCKKFYDAVLPDGRVNGDGATSMRCEHHDGVSRHRYRYAPPLTPEGFWNIGFESEM
ncbi:protein gamma response 1 [Hordeum vulgare]|uniref:DNA endonuclease activator Ctp1 C-terminal domain-containing protein n=1 Tax=Hordeum vulgare subsp. vulgare TaxID=112509 RepID=A0A8I6XRE6_HORVV|nr:protein gamma response 1 [Hordeum vulgare subsp. vulgare]KAE8776104.1 protein gamma response 1 [Hordeum vulgare]